MTLHCSRATPRSAMTILCGLAALAAGGRPGAAEEWSRPAAAHLLRRAGFGGTPEQIGFLAGLGRTGAVDYLLDIPTDAAGADRLPIAAFEEPDPQEMRMLPEAERQRLQMDRRRRDLAQLQRIRRQWVDRMITTPRPLEEKMVLFWHGHLTSGHREVRSSKLLYEQNELFRRYALGNYRTLLLEVCADPAMLLYLNNAQNVRTAPNENFARELLELFTLGPGHYSEADIKETARAFTGWGVDRRTGTFRFRPRLHDDGVKTVLGVRGRLNGGDVVDIILSRPRAAEHLVERLWRFFASDDPPRAVVRRLAAGFRRGRYELKPLLRAMFRSDAFYAESVLHARVKSPVELLVGSMRALEIPPVDTDAFVLGLRLMGQDLFQPPTVKGWDGGMDWINTATLFNRYNVTARLIGGTGGRRRGPAAPMSGAAGDDWAMDSNPPPSEPQPPFDPLPMLRGRGLRRAEDVVDHCVWRLLGRSLPPERREVLIDAFRRDLRGPDPTAPQNAGAVRRLLMLIVAMPEYQLS